MYRGVTYFCENQYGIGRGLSEYWVPGEIQNNPSPSESFTLYSFWLGRDSDTLLEWPPEPIPTPDFTFAYLEQD